MSSIAPEAEHRHREADSGKGGLHELVLDEQLNLAAHLLAVGILVQLLAARAHGALVAVGVAQHLVAGLHAARGLLLLAGRGGGSSTSPRGAGGGIGRRGGSKDGRSDEVGELGAQHKEGSVEQVRVAVSARRQRESEKEGRASHAGQSIEVGVSGFAQTAEGLGGR